ncbi:unnamed protein product [Tuber melanosporum]|uniref:(Perigord truffle) hypothetical protein n=1 Tax=Tuber melanosporum (strain Mel28) TaxID=656061 RepID=D5GJZ4_TUBMM|nr:uncharacterized protein GSTUM_00009283001 [Tuber melanosporum]CAZ84837.1 unnamed protein product [Tuber melanosporum]
MTYSTIQLPIKPRPHRPTSLRLPISHTTFFITITTAHYNFTHYNFIRFKMHASTLFLLAMSALTASAAPSPAPVYDHHVDGYAQHHEKEPQRYNFIPGYYDEKRYHRTPKNPPYGKDYVYGGEGYGGEGYGKGKDGYGKGKDGYDKGKDGDEFKKHESEEHKRKDDKYSKKCEEKEDEVYKKEKEKEKEEECKNFEECAESKDEKIHDEECCFEEGYGFDKGVKYDKCYGYYRDMNKKYHEDEHKKDKQAAKKDYYRCEEEDEYKKCEDKEKSDKCEECEECDDKSCKDVITAVGRAILPSTTAKAQT